MTLPDRGPCETCGTLSGHSTNGVFYCRPHFRDGFIFQARLVAWQRGMSPRGIEDLAEWASQRFDTQIEVMLRDYH